MTKTTDLTLPAASLEQIEAIKKRLRQAERCRRGMAEIAEIGQLLASDLNLDDVLDEFGQRTAQMLDCGQAILFLVTPDGLALRGQTRLNGKQREITSPLQDGLIGWVARQGRGLNLKDAYLDPRFCPKIDDKLGTRTRSALIQPVSDRKGRVIGVLLAINKLPSSPPHDDAYFSPDDEELLGVLTGQAGVIIRNARLFLDLSEKHHALFEAQTHLQERNAELDLMFSIERAAARAHDLDAALDGALDVTLGEYPCAAAAIVLTQEDSLDDRAPKRWWVQRAKGEGSHLFGQSSGLITDPLLHEVLHLGQLQILLDSPALPSRPSLLQGFAEIETLVMAPLKRQGAEPNAPEIIGALILVNSRRFPRVYDAIDRRKIQVIASRMALSVRLARAHDEERKAERMSAIGGALSGVVHDIRGPLTLLGAYARNLAREDDPQAREEIRGRHRHQIQRINGMIQGLLAFARGDTEILKTKIFIPEFARHLEESLRLELASRPITLHFESNDKGAIRMDEGKVIRALTNLIRNAEEAMAEKGGQITLRIGPAAALPNAPNDTPPDALAFQVIDTGPGIPPSIQDRLFQSFATHGKRSGTGLGLPIVKSIAEQHGGRITVESQPGQGSTFTLILPRDL